MLFRNKSNGDIVIFLNESEGFYHRYGFLARIVNVSKEQTILIKDEVQKKNELDKLEPVSGNLQLSLLSDKFKYELYEIFETVDNDMRYVFRRNDCVKVGIDKNSSLIGFDVGAEKVAENIIRRLPKAVPITSITNNISSNSELSNDIIEPIGEQKPYKVGFRLDGNDE